MKTVGWQDRGWTPPTPLHWKNDRATEVSAGPQMNARSASTGTASIAMTITRSARDSRRRAAGPATSPRRRPGGSVGAHDQKMVFACAARLLWIDLMVEAVGLAMNCWIAVSAAAAIAGSVSRSPNCETAFCPEIICTDVFWTWL